MGLLNFISEVLNREIVVQFNNFINNHTEAFRQWASGQYLSRTIIPDSELLFFDKAIAERADFLKPFKSNCVSSYKAFNYKQKKFVVEKKDVIIRLYDVYTHYKEVDSLFNSLKSRYPLVLRFLAEEHLGLFIDDANSKANLVTGRKGLFVIYSDLCLSSCHTTTIQSLANLSISQKEKLISYKDNFANEQERINQKIKECKTRKEQELIHDDFINKVLNNKRRNQWYRNFQLFKGINSEEYCIDHLLELDTYIADIIQQQYKEIKAEYPEGIKYYDAQNNFSEADHLEGIDYWEDCVHQKITIKEQHNIALKYNTLYTKYPNGITGYRESHQIIDDNLCEVFYPSKEEIVNLGEKKLAELEDLANNIKKNKAWIDEQAKSAQFSRNIHDEIFPNWGCYLYNLDIEYQTFSKEPNRNKYRIWEHFCSSYCSEPNLDYTYFKTLEKEYNETLPKLRDCKSFFRNNVYNQILKFICKLKSNYGSVLVLFGDSCVQNEEFNNYHFDYLKKQLENNGIYYGSKLNNIEVSNLYKHIIVVEVISTNAHLLEQCYNIISVFKEIAPFISYISLEKEMDRKEMEERISAKNAQLLEEKKKQEKIEKERLLQEKEERERQLQKQLDEARKERETKILCECVNNSYWYRPLRSSLQCFSMYNYYPTTCDFEANEDEWSVRNLIWDFKANPNKPMPKFKIMLLHSQAAKKLSDQMSICLRQFFGDSVCKLTLVCIPSSKKEITKRRYEDFSNIICTKLGMINAYPYVRVDEDGEAVHLGGIVHAEFSIATDFFKDKNVLLFDDVITRGSSMENFKLKLERAGAKVIGGFSIGRTLHERLSCNPIDNINQYNSRRTTSDYTDDLPF